MRTHDEHCRLKRGLSFWSRYVETTRCADEPQDHNSAKVRRLAPRRKIVAHERICKRKNTIVELDRAHGAAKACEIGQITLNVIDAGIYLSSTDYAGERHQCIPIPANRKLRWSLQFEQVIDPEPVCEMATLRPGRHSRHRQPCQPQGYGYPRSY